MKDLTAIPSLNRIERSFQRGLATYHKAATHQASIADQLVKVLLSSGAPKRIDRMFEFGSGTGHLTQALQSQVTAQQHWLNDLVPACQDYAPAGASFIAGPIEQIALPSSQNLICSANTIQWVADIPNLLKRIDRALAANGWLALSAFGTAQFHELRAIGSTASAPSYVNADGWHRLLPSDLKIKHLSQARRVEWFPDALTLLKHLRDTGVNGAAQEVWSRRKLREFETEYRNRFGTPKGLPLSYDPVWIVAQKTG